MLGASKCLPDIIIRHAPSRYCGDARVYGHTTTAMHEHRVHRLPSRVARVITYTAPKGFRFRLICHGRHRSFTPWATMSARTVPVLSIFSSSSSAACSCWGSDDIAGGGELRFVEAGSPPQPVSLPSPSRFCDDKAMVLYYFVYRLYKYQYCEKGITSAVDASCFIFTTNYRLLAPLAPCVARNRAYTYFVGKA